MSPAGKELIDRLEAAHQELCDAVERQWNGEAALKMSIPARLDHDTDLIIGTAITDAINALKEPRP